MFKNKAAILTLVLIFLPWFLPGDRVATDFPLTSSRGLEVGFNLPQTWTTRFGNGLGEYSVGTLWAWPLDGLFGLGAKLGLGFGSVERLIGVLPAIALGFLGMCAMVGPVGGLIYVVNSYFLMLVDGGQLGLALAYGLLPVCLHLYFRSLTDKRLISLLQLTFAVVLLSIADLRVIYLLVLVIASHFLFSWVILKERTFLHHLKIALVVGLFLLGFHSYWLAPAILSKPPALPAAYTSTNQISFLSFANLNHALLLAQPHWPKNIFGHVSPPPAVFIALPILAFGIFFLTGTSRKLMFWGCLALGSVFLAKGNNMPLSTVYPWLFANIPGFSLFRDPVKFYFLIGLAYAYLAGTFFKSHPRQAKYIFPLVLVYFVSLAWPIYSRQMTGTFSTPRFSQDFTSMNDFLEEDREFGRVLWVPSKPAMGFSGPDHPTAEGLQLQKYRPFTMGTYGTYETMNFLRDATPSAQLLQIAGIKYVVYPPLDPLRDSQKPLDRKYHDDFQSQLALAPWAGTKQQFGKVELIQTNRPVNMFYFPSTVQFVVGSDVVYDNTPDLTKSGLVFVEDYPDLLSRISQFPTAQVTLVNKTQIDVSAALVPSDQMIFPAINLPNSPDATGWWKRDSSDLLWWRSFLQEKYGLDNRDFDYHGGWAISEGENQLTLPIAYPIPEEAVLLARVLHSSRSGEVGFYQQNSLIGSLKTKNLDSKASVVIVKGLGEVDDKSVVFDDSDFLWSEVGHIPNNSNDLLIKTNGDINVVNALAIVSKSEWRELQETANQLLAQSGSMNGNAKISYKKMSPTHYRISVDNLAGPGMLVFSQNYDALWQLDGKEPVLTYSFLNGFPVSQDGEYDLTFSPQKHVLPGLAISILSIAIYAGLIVYTKLCAKK